MIGMELIKVRTSSANDKKGARIKIKALLSRIEMPGLQEIKAYTHATFPEDICVVLKWATDEPLEKGTATGLAFANEWKRFGLVDHAIWVEEDG